MINVRLATAADVPVIVRLGKELHTQSSYATKGFSHTKAHNAVAMIVDSATDVAFVAEDAEETIGFFLGGITYEWFSEDLIAFDYSVYVIPPKRNGRAAIKLFKAFEDWAIDKGATRIQVGITTNINLQNNSRLYHCLGFKDSGLLFEKEL